MLRGMFFFFKMWFDLETNNNFLGIKLFYRLSNQITLTIVLKGMVEGPPKLSFFPSNRPWFLLHEMRPTINAVKRLKHAIVANNTNQQRGKCKLRKNDDFLRCMQSAQKSDQKSALSPRPRRRHFHSQLNARTEWQRQVKRSTRKDRDSLVGRLLRCFCLYVLLTFSIHSVAWLDLLSFLIDSRQVSTLVLLSNLTKIVLKICWKYF